MQMTTSFPVAPADHSDGNNPNVVSHLQRSTIFRDYKQAFETTTGLPLALREAGSFLSPLHGSKRANPFCALMKEANKSCAACLQLQDRVETDATSEAKTLECFAGLSESAIPVKAGNKVLGYLQTGQIFLQQPSRARFKRVLLQLSQWGSLVDARELEAAYFKTRVVAKKQYASMVSLLGIFAQHLASMSNQVMVSETQTELPAIAKARALIAAQQGEDISLGDAARAANMSAFYFCKVFKSVTGLTFTDYLARVRVETVKKMLLNPHARMSEAAYAAGFQSLSQFNRVFHRVMGETPSSYHDGLHRATKGVRNPASLSRAA